MLRPVSFLYQFYLRRVEIHDIIPDGPLSIKLNPLNLLPPQFPSQCLLGVCHFSTQAPTQAILNSLEMQVGDRLLLEAIAPHRVMITKEIETLPNSRRIELELQVLEAKHTAVEKEFSYLIADNNLSTDWDNDILEAACARVEREVGP